MPYVQRNDLIIIRIYIRVRFYIGCKRLFYVLLVTFYVLVYVVIYIFLFIQVQKDTWRRLTFLERARKFFKIV